MDVQINGRVLEVNGDVTFEELIKLSKEAIDYHQSLTELKIDQEIVSQSTLNQIKECPIADFTKSKIELFSTPIHEIISEILDKAMEYIKRVEKIKNLTYQDLDQIIEGFQWLNFALIQINMTLNWQKDEDIKKLIWRNSCFCDLLIEYQSDENLSSSQVTKNIARELNNYRHLIKRIKEEL